MIHFMPIPASRTLKAYAVRRPRNLMISGNLRIRGFFLWENGRNEGGGIRGKMKNTLTTITLFCSITMFTTTPYMDR
jgi:hypothetical protein